MVAELNVPQDGNHLKNLLLPHTTAVKDGFDALRVEWRARALTELESRQKGERRRQRSARLLGLEPVDPTDCLPYTVYPIEPEVMVRTPQACCDAGSSCCTHVMCPFHLQDAITIFNGDLKRLGPGEYLNDSLIDLKLKYLAHTALNAEQRARVHVFNCMFYSRLTAERQHDAGHGLVARWTKNIDVFDRDFILIPINYTYHWSLAVIVRPGALLVRNFAYLICWR
jgi:hypothetical protein